MGTDVEEGRGGSRVRLEDRARPEPRDPAATPAPPTDHVACIYGDVFQLYSMAGRFLRDGIQRGEKVCIVATESSRAVFESILGGVGIDVPAGKRRGQIVVHDAEETLGAFMIDGIQSGSLDPKAFESVAAGLVDRASAEGRYPGVRVYGEMASLLWEQGNRAAMASLESLWNDVRESHRFELLCPHRRESFGACDAESFEALCGLHSRVERTHS